MKRTKLFLTTLTVLAATCLNAQVINTIGKTKAQLSQITAGVTQPNKTWFETYIFQRLVEYNNAFLDRSLSADDYATLRAAALAAIDSSWSLVVPGGEHSLDSLTLTSPLTIYGIGIKRIKTTDSDYYGSRIKSSNTSGQNLLNVKESGVFLHDISLQGTLTNGHGYYSQRPFVSGSINTTLGGYGLARVNSFNNGGSGFYIVGPDGNLFDELESFNNLGYGVVAISPDEAGLSSAGATAAGTTSLFRGGRSRRNKLGGWFISDQAAVGLHHIEAVGDTSIGVWFDAGRSRSYMLGTDVEMQIPALTSTPLTTGVRVEDMQGFLMAQNFIGTQHDVGTTYTADSGTNTTTIVDAALANYGPDGYLIGWDVVNSTRSSGEVKVTGYTASTGTLTLTSAITGQTTGDSFTLSKDQNVGLRLHNLTSGVFINNTFGSNVDTMIATVGDGGALFVNNINFDPEDNLKEISGTFKWLYINTANVDSLSGGANTILMKSSNDFIIQSLDSLLLRSTGASKGVEISAAGKVAIQPEASAGVHLFGNSADGETQDLRIYGDANVTASALNLQYVALSFSDQSSNTFTINNSADSIRIGFGARVLISGQNQTERMIEFLNHSGGTSISTPSSGYVRIFSRGDTLYAKNDNGNEHNLFASGSGITTATARRYTGWTATGSSGGTATDTLATKFILDHKDLQFHVVDADNDSSSFVPQSLYPYNYKDATTQLAAHDSLGRFFAALGYDAVGAAPIEIGSADVTAITLTTDGTGDAEVVLPAQSISSTEILNSTVAATDMADADHGDVSWSGNVASVDNGAVALDELSDVDITGASSGNTLVRRASGVWVDSTLSGTGDVVGPASSTDEAVARFDGTTGKLLQNTSALTLSDAGAFSFADGVKQTFNPDGTNSGINVGSQAGNPSASAVGDIWLNSTTNRLMAKEETYNFPILFDPSLVYRKYEDWDAGATSTSGAMGVDWLRTIATSGSTTKEPGESGAPGIMRLFCANSAGSVAALHTDTDIYILDRPYTAKARIRFSTLGTATTNGAYYRIGYMDDVGATIPTDGAWIEFNVDSSATRWRAITGNGGTRTITTYTGSTVSATTWYKLEIVPNSNATSYVFKVDGTTIATHTTDLPSGAVGFALVAAAVTASSTKFMSNDYVLIQNLQMSR